MTVKILYLAGIMSERARLIVGGRGINFNYSPANCMELGDLLRRLKDAVDSYDEAMLQLSCDLDQLAQDIREVDGQHSLGAGALAEKLYEKGWRKY